MSSDAWYYATDDRQQHGPVTQEELRGLVAAGQVRLTNLVWSEGMSQWSPASSVAALRAPGAAVPPPIPQNMVPPPAYAYANMPPSIHQDIANSAGMRMLMPVGRSGWAIAAGYLGLFSFIVFPAPLALIVSIIAIRDIKNNPGTHGMGRAIFGLITGVVFTLVLILMIAAMAVHR